MITTQLTPRSTREEIAFMHDGNSKIFAVKGDDSNLPAPIVELCGPGKLTLIWQPMNIGMPITVIFHEEHEETKAEVVSWWRTMKKPTKVILKWLAITLLTTVLGGGLIVVDKKYNRGSVGEWYRSVSVFGVADRMQNVDSRIFTNEHEVYATEGVKEIEEELNIKLRDVFHFVGDGLFVQKKLSAIQVDYDTAEDFCDARGAQIPTKKELDENLSGTVGDYVNFVWPIKADNNKPEWTSTELNGDFYYIAMKNSIKPPKYAEEIDGVLGGEEDDSKMYFRCVFREGTFIEAD